MEFDSLDSRKVLKWECIQAIGDLPDARRCHSLNAVGTSRLVLFGGDGHGGVRLKNDTYVFHINEKRWEKLNIKGHQLPPQRWYHTATSLIPNWSDESPLYNSHILVFGGRSAFSYLNDVFLLDIENQTWTRIVPKGDTPAPRWCHTMTLLPGHRILLFGGSYEMGRSRQKYGFDEFHVLHLDKMEWKKYPIQVGFKNNERVNLHLQRESHTTCYSNNNIYISFGCSMQDEAVATVLVMDPETLQIMRVIDTSQLIPPLPTRQGSSATPLFQTNATLTQTVNRIVFFGGEKDSKDRQPLSDIIVLETESERWFRSTDDFTVLPPTPEHSINNNNNEPAVRLERAYQAAEGIGSKVYVFGGQAESYENLLSDLLVLETEVCPPTLVDRCIKFVAGKESNLTLNDFLPLPAELTERIIQEMRNLESNRNYLKDTDRGSLENASTASATETVDISEMSAQNEENEDESDSIFFSSFYDSMLSTLSDKNLDDETLQFHIQQVIALLGLESTIQQMNVPQNKVKDTLIRILLFAKMQLQLEPLDNHPEEDEDDDTSDNMSTVAVSSHAGERNQAATTADDNDTVITDDMSLNSMNLQEEEDSDSQES